MRCLITGSAGFIGSNLADELIEQGHEVVGIDNLSTGRIGNVNPAMEFHDGDILGLIPYGPFDVIYHAAASYKDRDEWERDALTNVLGTIAVVREAMKHGSKLVYFQTSLCYGLAPHSPVETDAQLRPQGSYAVSKTAGEAYIRDSGVEYVSLRLANIYGPRNLSGPIPTFYQRLSAGETCTVADSRRDFVFIDDLVRVAVMAAVKGRGIYNVSSGSDVSIEDIYWAVVRAMGSVGGPDGPYPEFRERGPDDVPTLLLNPSDTGAEFGWVASTPLVYGIKEAIAWYKANPVFEAVTHLGPPAAVRA
jgi:UDP-glucose 4-epimerase